MSLKSELQEVVDWLSDLTAESDPAPQPVYRENWKYVRDNLGRAGERFHAAVAALERKHSPLVDFARDLERDTEGLRLRAALLEQRAPKKSESAKEIAALREKLAEKEKTLKETTKKLNEVEEELETATRRPDTAAIAPPHDKRKKRKAQPSVSDLVGRAAHSLETAHGHVLDGITYPERPDAVADAFANELDLLSELTLSLRLQLEAEEQAEEAKGKEAKAKERAARERARTPEKPWQDLKRRLWPRGWRPEKRDAVEAGGQ